MSLALYPSRVRSNEVLGGSAPHVTSTNKRENQPADSSATIGPSSKSYNLPMRAPPQWRSKAPDSIDVKADSDRAYSIEAPPLDGFGEQCCCSGVGPPSARRFTDVSQIVNLPPQKQQG